MPWRLRHADAAPHEVGLRNQPGDGKSEERSDRAEPPDRDGNMRSEDQLAEAGCHH